jgi:hypothetical protein
MNRLKIILLILLVINTKVLSQNLEFEVIGGPALTSLRGNDFIENNFDPAFNVSASVGVNYILKNNLLITLAINYERKGGISESYLILKDQQNQVIGEGNVTNTSNFDYLTIPIQFGKRFGEKIKYQFGVGMYTSILLKQESSSKGLGGLVNLKENGTDLFKKIDLGFLASFNIYLPINDSVSIKIGIDDYLGLVNVSDGSIQNNGTIKHNSLGLVLGLNFKLNRI